MLFLIGSVTFLWPGPSVGRSVGWSLIFTLKDGKLHFHAPVAALVIIVASIYGKLGPNKTFAWMMDMIFRRQVTSADGYVRTSVSYGVSSLHMVGLQYITFRCLVISITYRFPRSLPHISFLSSYLTQTSRCVPSHLRHGSASPHIFWTCCEQHLLSCQTFWSAWFASFIFVTFSKLNKEIKRSIFVYYYHYFFVAYL